MNANQKRIAELLDLLDDLDRRHPAPEAAPIHEVARQALLDELSRVAHADGLAIYRSGNTLDAISYAGWLAKPTDGRAQDTQNGKTKNGN